MHLRARRHWIFDLDGTLTLAQHDFEAIRRDLGLPAGRPILEQLAAMSVAEAAPIHAELERIEEDLAKEAEPAPGAASLLADLHRTGMRLGILTRNKRRLAHIALKATGLARYFETDVVLGRDEAAPKPSPDGVQRILQTWGADPSDAVMLGDYLISNAFHLAASIGDADLTERLGRTTNTLCEGELIQLHHRDDLGLDFPTYLEVIRRKTAVLVGACGRLGARLAGGTDATCEGLGEFGERLGIAFQVRDDILDLEGDVETVGKTVGRDLEKGKLTLPMILLLDGGEPAVFAEAVEAFRARDAVRLLELLRRGDAIDRARAFAVEEVGRAVEVVDDLDVGDVADLLRDLARAVVDRDR